MKKIAIIGSGFSALASACYLAQEGNDVTIYEKNGDVGGRARRYKKDGFTFDIGPTFYWMPDVFERFFNDFGKKQKDYYTIDRLNPGYEVYFGIKDSFKISSDVEEIVALFEEEESGAGDKLRAFLKQAQDNYDIAVKDIVYKPGVSPLELVTPETIARLHLLLTNIQGQIRRKIKSKKLRKVLEFPVLFLGAKPSNTPALYNFMNWADFGLGTWHPRGGMYSVVLGIKKLAEELGVKFETNANVEQIILEKDSATGLRIRGNQLPADIILSGADYHHTESLLDIKYRQYSEGYWSRRTFAPSSLLFYVGFDKKLKNVSHHTLFFDADFEAHAVSIYDKPAWPKDPLFYASFSSITDPSSAPEGKEAATFLIPLAPDLEDTEEERQRYFDIIMTRLEQLTGQSLKNSIMFSKSYCVNDFKEDYNSYKGNAYGLANILTQTAFLRPRIKSKKVKNLFFTGQLTVPGPGVPPALISGKIASKSIMNSL